LVGCSPPDSYSIAAGSQPLRDQPGGIRIHAVSRRRRLAVLIAAGLAAALGVALVLPTSSLGFHYVCGPALNGIAMCSGPVDETLDPCSIGPASEYVDVFIPINTVAGSITDDAPATLDCGNGVTATKTGTQDNATPLPNEVVPPGTRIYRVIYSYPSGGTATPSVHFTVNVKLPQSGGGTGTRGHCDWVVSVAATSGYLLGGGKGKVIGLVFTVTVTNAGTDADQKGSGTCPAATLDVTDDRMVRLSGGTESSPRGAKGDPQHPLMLDVPSLPAGADAQELAHVDYLNKGGTFTVMAEMPTDADGIPPDEHGQVSVDVPDLTKTPVARIEPDGAGKLTFSCLEGACAASVSGEVEAPSAAAQSAEAATSRKRRPRVLGTVRGSVAAGRRGKVTIHLSKVGLTMLRKHHRLRVQLVLSVTDKARTGHLKVPVELRAHR
jgi:hypothetical protein